MVRSSLVEKRHSGDGRAAALTCVSRSRAAAEKDDATAGELVAKVLLTMARRLSIIQDDVNIKNAPAK